MDFHLPMAVCRGKNTKRNVTMMRMFAAAAVGFFCWASPLLSETALTLSDLPSVLHDAVHSHPGKGELDQTILLQSHDKLFAQFDPGKIYLLEREIAPYVDPKNGEKYLSEYQHGDFRQYFAMIELCQKAVERSRTIRSGFFFTDSQSIDAIRETPKESYTEYAADMDDLSGRVFHKYLRLIASRLSKDSEGDSEAVKEAVSLAEKELEDEEIPWLKLSPNGSPKSRSSVALVILKSVVSALDVHSDVVESEGARQMRERLTKQAFGTGIVPNVNEAGCIVREDRSGVAGEPIRLDQGKRSDRLH